jgi:hypothetical protein
MMFLRAPAGREAHDLRGPLRDVRELADLVADCQERHVGRAQQRERAGIVALTGSRARLIDRRA